MQKYSKSKTIVVTGCAGFIGFHLCKTLIKTNHKVIGIDILNDYYDVQIKYDRLAILYSTSGEHSFKFYKVDISDLSDLIKIFEEEKVDIIVNLAAQAGVRYSLENPHVYQQSNLQGFLNMLEMARHSKVENFVFASSSSVYGKNKNSPYSVDDRVDNPISLYAATKKANELMAHSYSHLYGIPCTGLRYFTVYGPWGRPDMALFLFTKAILESKPIKVFNYGAMKRDFTYIDDIISGTIGAIENPFSYQIFNIGSCDPYNLIDFIYLIEEELGIKTIMEMLPMQPGDVAETVADITSAKEKLDYNPKTPLRQGIKNFITWYKEYYKV